MDLKSQPLQVQRNVKALKRLLYQQKKMESDMYKDIHKLEGYFYKIHQSKIYNERLKQVEGVLNQSTIIEEDENGEDNPSSEMQEPGIPGFWLRVFLNSKNLSQIVQVRGCKLPLFHLYFINIFFNLGSRHSCSNKSSGCEGLQFRESCRIQTSVYVQTK